MQKALDELKKESSIRVYKNRLRKRIEKEKESWKAKDEGDDIENTAIGTLAWVLSILDEEEL